MRFRCFDERSTLRFSGGDISPTHAATAIYASVVSASGWLSTHQSRGRHDLAFLVNNYQRPAGVVSIDGFTTTRQSIVDGNLRLGMWRPGDHRGVVGPRGHRDWFLLRLSYRIALGIDFEKLSATTSAQRYQQILNEGLYRQ